MSNISLILIVLIIVLFVKVGRLRKNLSLRLGSLEQAVSNLKLRISKIEAPVSAASEEAASEAEDDTQQVTEPAGAKITEQEGTIDEKKIEPESVTVAPEPPPLHRPLCLYLNRIR
jgi:Sec-independent protein translocase protein TatA